jgi:uncharacterized protein (TIGR04255 family)
VTKKYRNPPIIEAVCEFRFPPSVSWDLTIHGLMFGKIQKEFPNKTQQIVQNVNFTQTPEGLQQQVVTSEQTIFSTDDKRLLIQLGSHILAINCLEPYPTWEGFKPQMQKAFTTLTGIIDVKELERISFRTVNRIVIPKSPIDLSAYFEFRPFLGEQLPHQPINFVLACSFDFCDERDICQMQLTNVVPNIQSSVAFILDFNYFLAKPGSISAQGALEWVDTAHLKLNEMFEGCITDQLRAIFGE